MQNWMMTQTESLISSDAKTLRKPVIALLPCYEIVYSVTCFSDLEQGLLIISLRCFVACGMNIGCVFAFAFRVSLISYHTAFLRTGVEYPGSCETLREGLTGQTEQRRRGALHISYLLWSKSIGLMNSTDRFLFNPLSLIQWYLIGLLRSKYNASHTVIQKVQLFSSITYVGTALELSIVVAMSVKLGRNYFYTYSVYQSYLNEISVQNSLINCLCDCFV